VIFSHVLYQLSYLGGRRARRNGPQLIGGEAAPCPAHARLRHLYVPVETAMHRARTCDRETIMRFVIACLSAAAAVCLFARSAAAADLPTAPSSYPALGPGPAEPAPDPWAGLSVGAGVSVWGGKGVKGGVGGETDLSYEHVFDNGVMLGVQAATGYMPFLQSSPGFTQFSGSAFAGGSAIVGYNMGQVTPYVITGVDFIRPTRFTGGIFNASDAVNSVFSGPGAVQAVGTLGVGVNYRITSNFSMGLEAVVHTYPNAGRPFAPWP
jgi:hypothetical protein